MAFSSAQCQHSLYAHSEELYGHPIGSETSQDLEVLVQSLDLILPGIGVKKLFCTLNGLTHQNIVDVLGSTGAFSITPTVVH